MKTIFKLLQAVLFLSIITFAISCSDDEETPKVDCTTSDLTAAATASEVSCSAMGTIEASSTGGSGNVEFSIDGANFQASGSFENLTAKSYTVTVKDANECTSTATITVSGEATSTVAFTTSEVDSGCGDSKGSITVAATGGNGTYEYSIDEGSFGTSNTFSNLEQGSYTVTVKDGDDCDKSSDVTVNSGISYSASVATIIANSCAVSGCHVAGTDRQDFTQFSLVQSNAAGIMSRTASGNMPAGGGSLSPEEIDAIACWVNDGGLDN